jgi:hypothetical protein
MIRDEHPQIIATILVHLERHQASDILQLLPDRLRNDIILRIATFSGVQPVALQELTEVLGTMLDGQSLKRSKMGGVRTAAEILNLMSSTHEERPSVPCANTAKTWRRRSSTRCSCSKPDRRGRPWHPDPAATGRAELLAIALKGSPPALLERFLHNMSQRAGQLFREDMEARGPIRMSQIETEQKAILAVVRRLSDSGDIVPRAAMTPMSDWQPWQMDPLASPATSTDDPHSSHRERLRKQAFQHKLDMQVLREKTSPKPGRPGMPKAWSKVMPRVWRKDARPPRWSCSNRWCAPCNRCWSCAATSTKPSNRWMCRSPANWCASPWKPRGSWPVKR